MCAVSYCALFYYRSSSLSGRLSEIADSINNEISIIKENASIKKCITLDDLEITYYLYSKDENTDYCALLITNTSDTTIQVVGSATAIDKDSRKIAVDDVVVNYIGPQETSIDMIHFKDTSGTIDIELQLETNVWNTNCPVVGNLISEISCYNNKAIVTVINKGNDEVYSIYGYALFFDKNGNLIDYKWTLFYNLKADKSITSEYESDTSFDYVEVYYQASPR